MDLFFNCYVLGAGYTIKRINWDGGENGEIQEIGLSDLPAYLTQSFTQNSTGLFLDCTEGNWYGCVRSIPHYLRSDGDNRECYLNIALSGEEGSADEAEEIGAFVHYARDHKESFTAFMSRVVYYTSASQDYYIDLRALKALITAARSEPEQPLEPLSCLDKDWTSHTPDRNVFFCCSTPSMGFVLRRIDPTTGVAYRYGTKKGQMAESQLLPYEKNILDNGGASMALFEQSGRCCFVSKGITYTDEKNNDLKNLSLIIDVPVSDAVCLQRMASYALFSNSSFSEAVASCVEVFAGPGGYRVLPDRLSGFLSLFDHNFRRPDNLSDDAGRIWDQLNQPGWNEGFRLVVLETTYDYFERISKISIPVEKQSNVALVSYDLAEKLVSRPFRLVSATEDETKIMTRPPAETADASVLSGGTEEALKRKALESNESLPKTSPEEPFPNSGIQKSEALKKSDALGAAENVSDETGDSSDEEDSFPEDRIDLLDYKWFLPAMVAVGVLIIAVIGIIIIHGKMKGGLP